MSEEKKQAAEEMRSTMEKLETLPKEMQSAVTSYLQGMVAAYELQQQKPA